MSEFIDQDHPKMEDLNLQDETTKINSELSADVAVQEPQVKDFEEDSRPIVCGVPASCSAIESTKLCDDVSAQETKGKDSEEDSNPTVRGVPASCSAIDEANKKTDSSSPRNDESSETGEITREDEKEDHDSNHGDDKYKSKESDDKLPPLPAELDHIASESLQQNPLLYPRHPFGTQKQRSPYANRSKYGFWYDTNVAEESIASASSSSATDPCQDQIARRDEMMNPQQQQQRSPYAGPSPDMTDVAIDPYQDQFASHPQPLYQNPRYPFGTQRPQYPYHQHHPVANQIPNRVPMDQMFIRGPGRLENSSYQQHPMAIPILIPCHVVLPIPYPLGNQQTLYQCPLAYLIPTLLSMPGYERQQLLRRLGMWLRPMHGPMIQHPLANQHYLYYQRPMVDKQNLRNTQVRSNELLTVISPSGQQRLVAVFENFFKPGEHFAFPMDGGGLNHLEMLQLQIQMQLPSQRFGAGTSSKQGRDQHKT